MHGETLKLAELP